MMIEINLLPPELKIKEAKAGTTIDRSMLLNIGVIALAVVLIATLCLGITSIYRARSLKSLNKEWADLELQRKALAETKVKYSALIDASSIRRKMTSRRMAWAGKLSALSRYVPSGMWLRDLAVTSKDFTLSGSVVVVLKDEMGVIKGFVDDLKSDPGFADDFATLELGTVKKRDIGPVSVADFTLSGVLKQ